MKPTPKRARLFFVHDFSHGWSRGPFTKVGADRVSFARYLRMGGDVGVSRSKDFWTASGDAVIRAPRIGPRLTCCQACHDEEAPGFHCAKHPAQAWHHDRAAGRGPYRPTGRRCDGGRIRCTPGAANGCRVCGEPLAASDPNGGFCDECADMLDGVHRGDDNEG